MTKSLGLMSLFSRMAFKTPPPSLPVALVTARGILYVVLYEDVGAEKQNAGATHLIYNTIVVSN